jgi:cellulose synthase operon protein YhjU
MSYWSLYFLIKVGLHHSGTLALQWGWNLLLAACLLWPLASANGRRLRLALALPAAAVLLYRESFWPSPERILSQLEALKGFSADYMLELLLRVVQPRDVLALVALVLVYSVLAKRIRFSSLALLAIASVPAVALWQSPHSAPLAGPARPAAGATAGVTADTAAGTAAGTTAPTATDPDSLLRAFYATESQRKLVLSAGGRTPPFDIILLNICSLGWDDMDHVGLREHPLMRRFDVVFNQFNSAASYSGPGLIRLMYGTCGQRPENAMYDGMEPNCYALPSLERIGFRTAGLMNHDGVFENFGASVEKLGGLSGKMVDNRQAPVLMQSFDGTPIYSDHALLSQWWKDRQRQDSQPVALYYNSISLHDGNRVPGYNSRSSVDTYKPRLTQLLGDLDRFLTELETAGRPVVVVLVPEHGASLRGDRLQIAGMREIPGPRITQVPVGLKIVGANKPAASGGQVQVDQPMSYFGLFTLLNDLLGNSPFEANAQPLAARVQGLPTTPLVSENDDVVVMGNATEGYWLRSGNGAWVPYRQ